MEEIVISASVANYVNNKDLDCGAWYSYHNEVSSAYFFGDSARALFCLRSVILKHGSST